MKVDILVAYVLLLSCNISLYNTPPFLCSTVFGLDGHLGHAQLGASVSPHEPAMNHLA